MEKPLIKDTNLRVIFGITLMAVLGVASITPAFPKIVRVLGISTEQVGFLITVFTFPGIIMTPVLGVLADRYGRKRIIVPSLFLFGLAGGACAFTNDFNTLLVFRFFQGMGAASLGSLNTTLIGDLFSGQRLRAAMGYNGGVLNIGTASYPAIGGLLAAAAWNYPFLMPLAAVPMGLVVLFFLNNPEPQSKQSLKDYLENTWKSFKNKQVAILFTASLVTFIILYGTILTYYPFFMKQRFGSSVVVIGLYISFMSVGSGLFSSQLGRLSKKFPAKNIMITAWACYAVAMIAAPLSPNMWMFLIPTLLYGIANGLNIPMIQSLLADLSPLEYRAAFMSTNGMVLRLGQTLGPIIMGGCFALWNIEGTFIAAAAISVLMMLLIKTAIK